MVDAPKDLSLPNAVVSRIVKETLPEGTVVSKDARTAMNRAATVFILYATNCANMNAVKSKRKTISAQDVLAALDDMEFTHFIRPLEEALEQFKEEQGSKRMASEKRKRDKKAASGALVEDGVVAIDDDEEEEDQSESPDAKRQKKQSSEGKSDQDVELVEEHSAAVDIVENGGGGGEEEEGAAGGTEHEER